MTGAFWVVVSLAVVVVFWRSWWLFRGIKKEPTLAGWLSAFVCVLL